MSGSRLRLDAREAQPHPIRGTFGEAEPHRNEPMIEIQIVLRVKNSPLSIV